ncbi:cytochrome P450 2F3-like [Uloborus diversus]|uniref:cytochrome P450 2F3-like n=1 Tax=Uloborus diversus TaxID=327109 RepID=UPI002409D9C1|nr:cytochrome P450 2F3-like [Uloborus diversus]XP_054711512.1 cytochrome P450 2F3-like [Uloborus diversus]XP_054711513.1 cytochrome P450 2F3-like [Uloborus diversus]
MLQSLSDFPPYSLVIAGATLLLTILYFIRKNSNVLPGPRGLPYFGLFPGLTHDGCHLQLQEYTRKYGDVFSFTYMGNLFIHLGTVKAMREVHVQKSDCFEERFTRFSILTYLLSKGVAMTNGEPWKILRKFFVQNFKEYGMSSLKDTTDGPIYESLVKTIEDIRQKKGQSFNVIDLLVERCSGIIKKMIFGIDGVTGEELRILNETYAVALDGMTGNKMMFIGPFGKLIFRTLPSYRIAIDQHRIMSTLLYKICRRIELNFDGEHPTNMIENFYRERKIRQQKKDPTAKHFTDEMLVESLSQFVGDGIISVSYFIGCLLYALVHHPEEQDKLYEEIKEVVGFERLPTLEDRSRMPYTNAFLYECIRTSNMFSIFPSLECTKETTVRGYRIPKGSITLLNFWSANQDPETFPNPSKFDPQRFITNPGQPKQELPNIFGVGKRACTGEPLVMMESFLFLTTIVRNFRIAEVANPKSMASMFLTTGNMELTFYPRSEK